MKVLKLTAVLIFIFFNSQAQSIIDFVANPTVTGPDTWDPTYWTRGGCGGSQKWGPLPLPVSGHNVRLVGASSLYPLTPGRALYLNAGRNGTDPQVETHQDYNAILSVEYSFDANKTYLIEFTGIKDESWFNLNYYLPSRYKRAVFWVKLDDSPNINTPSQNPCGYDLHPVYKSVGRYSKLIADPSMAFEDKTYSVKFSTKEAKSALKIVFDPSPVDPNLSFASKFGLRNIKITEIPYEEDGRYVASYTNAPRPPRGTPGYEIDVENPPSTRPNDPRRPRGSVDFSVLNSAWILNANGIGYTIYADNYFPSLTYSELIDVYILGDNFVDPRSGTIKRAALRLPNTYQGNNYDFQIVNGEILISSSNVSPQVSNEFQITYYE